MFKKDLQLYESLLEGGTSAMDGKDNISMYSGSVGEFDVSAIPPSPAP